ncbi:serine/threonine-protein kinase [Nonomuraea cavernae]|uniref:serine/threonine-protein kinase n=1 Tax=Nonomuraea cavernae TaxID=2045107 RepID=UPI0033E2F8B5
MQPLSSGDPTRIGKYVVTGRLGAGGMGQVFLARSPGGLPIAIKVIHSQLAGDAEFRSRFRKELNSARAVGGAYTAAVVDADPDADRPWLATAFLPGLSLQDTIAAHGPLPVESVRTLGAGLAEALISIHRAGVVHRDLKPSNIIVTPQGPRVIDFGIARAADATAATQSGMVMGSPGYVTPEQVTANVAGPAGDIFSLGAVLAYAVTGVNPFGEGPSHVLVYRVVHEPPQLDGVPDGDLRDLIAACLAKKPEDRPTTEEVLDRLAAGDEAPGPAWLPVAVADNITARIDALPLTKVLPSGESPEQVGPLPSGESSEQVGPPPSGKAPARAGPPPWGAVPVPGGASHPPDDEDDVPDEPLTPLRRRLAGVLVVVGVAAAVLGVTRPALWGGEVCADIGPQLATVTILPPRPMTTADSDANDRQRAAYNRQRAAVLTSLAARAEDPRLKRALTAAAAADRRDISTSGRGNSVNDYAEIWGEVRAACG